MFIKRYLAERIYETEIRLEEQSEKTESCWENLWNETQLKTRQTEEVVGRQHQGMDRPGVGQFPISAVEKREKWRKLVAKSSVVPLRPSRLRDR